MPFGEDNGGDRASDLDVDSDDLSSDEDEEEDIMMQPAPAAKKRKKVQPAAKAQRKVEDDRKPAAVAVAQGRGQRKAKVKATAMLQEIKDGGDRAPAVAAARKRKPPKSEKQRESARISMATNRQKGKVAKKIQLMKEENVTPTRMLAKMIDDTEIEIVSWFEVADTSGQKHWCVYCCDANGILTHMETLKQKKYVMRSDQGVSRESYFKSMFLPRSEQDFHRVTESEPKEGQKFSVGDDWFLLMHHPDFTQGSDGKVDWTRLANIVGNWSNSWTERDEIDWDLDDDLKTKRQRKTYCLNYRLDDNLPWSAPGNRVNFSLGSYYNDQGSDKSQRGIRNHELAKAEVEKRRKKGQCIKQETMMRVLDKEGYRLVANAKL